MRAQTRFRLCLFYCLLGLSSHILPCIQAFQQWYPSGEETQTKGSVLHSEKTNSSLVGATTGSFIVEDTGSASYTIPLVGSPGISKMQPAFGVSYSSAKTGNHQLGRGFYLEGLSTIHRCPSTLEQDGRVHSIDFTYQDNFCIDGMRLVPRGTTVKNGVEQIEYGTEIETFAKIVAHGNPGTDTSSWFEVHTKAGINAEYGANTNSRVLAQGKQVVNVWALSSRKDRSNNYYTFTYAQDKTNGEYYIVSANYTGNTKAGISPMNSFEFIYEDRPDINAVFINGSVMRTTKRLVKVRTYTNNTIQVMEYRLSYKQAKDVGESLLATIQECDYSGDCFPPTSFTWDETSIGAAWKSSLLGAPLHLGSGTAMASLDMSRQRFADLNGDGLMDIYVVTGFGGTPEADQIYINEGSGVFAATPLPGPKTAVRGWIDAAQVDLGRIKLVDFNSDGAADVYIIDGTGKADQIYLNDGQGNFDATPLTGPVSGVLLLNENLDEAKVNLSRLQFADFNGDSRVDLYIVEGMGGASVNDQVVLNLGMGNYTTFSGPPTPVGGWLEGAGIDIRRVKCLDMNGDGMADVYHLSGDGTPDTIYLSKSVIGGDGYAYENIGKGPVTVPIGSMVDEGNFNISRVRFGDFNGDGIADIYIVNENDDTGHATQDTIYISQGNVLEYNSIKGPEISVRNWLAAGNTDLRRIQCVDVNGDGMTDVYHLTGTGQPDVVYLSTELKNSDVSFSSVNGPVTVQLSGAQSQDNFNLSRVSMTDLDGDGTLDVYIIQSHLGTSQKGQSLLSPTLKPELTQIIDGFGGEIKVHYESMTNKTVYEKMNDAKYPVLDTQTSSRVVSTVEKSNGIGGFRSAQYHYKGAKRQLRGIGHLGFREVYNIEQATGLKMWTRYNQNYTVRLQHKREQMMHSISNGTVVEMVSRTLDARVLNGGKQFFPYTSQETLVNRDLDMSLIKNSTTDFQYDEWGNLIYSKEVVTGPKGSNPDQYGAFTKIERSSFINNVTNWHIGLVNRTESTVQRQGQNPITRVALFTYCNKTALLKTKTQDPNTADILVEKYERDDFGHVSSTTVTPTGMNSRTSSATFSLDGRFMLSSTNTLGHTSYSYFDHRFGGMVESIDPNGVHHWKEYDNFGRLKKETWADKSHSDIIMEWCSSKGANCPSGSIFFTHTVDRVGVPSTVYFDKLTRAIYSKGLGGNGQTVMTHTIYDHLERKVNESLPYFTGSQPHWTQYFYDILNRQIRTLFPDGTTRSVEHHGLTIIGRNALDQVNVRMMDPVGNMIETVDHMGHHSLYQYDSNSKLIQTVSPKGIMVNMTYDFRGRLTNLSDPDRGKWSYLYDALNQQIVQHNLLNNTVTKTKFDLLGRTTAVIMPEGTDCWEYDQCANGIGKLCLTKNAQFNETYTYDELGRPKTSIRRMHDTGGRAWTTTTQYDQFSRVNGTLYPSKILVQTKYNKFGFAYQILDSAAAVGETILSWDAKGQVLQKRLGNGVTTDYTFDVMGRPTHILTQPSVGDPIQNLTYHYDALGNVKTRSSDRKDIDRVLSELVQYDDLNRITSSHTTAGRYTSDTSFKYDEDGNIIFKSDVGTYSYSGNSLENDGAGPHAITSTSSPHKTTYKYDKTGNMISGAGRTIKYNSFSKPTFMDQNGKAQVYFGYGTGHQLIYTFRQSSLSYDYTYQLGGSTELVISSKDGEKQRNYIGDFAMYTFSSSTVKQKVQEQFRNVSSNGGVQGRHDGVVYFHYDNLGSIEAITDATGDVVERQSYDAFGKRRNPDTWKALTTPPKRSNITDRGYTGHDELLSVGLINMGGRIYDPLLGRFLSADPVMNQHLGYSQSLNPYSYVVNNPLSLTDPTGFSWLSRGLHHLGHAFHWIGHAFRSIGHAIEHALQHSAILRSVVRLAVQAIATTACGGNLWCGAVADSLFSAYLTKIQGGSWGDALKAGVISFAQDAAFIASGTYFDPKIIDAGNTAELIALKAQQAVVHGLIRGAVSVAQGGKFQSGLLSGIVSVAGGLLLPSLPIPFGGEIRSGILGGLGSMAGGGSFESGFITGAAGYFFNENLNNHFGISAEAGAAYVVGYAKGYHYDVNAHQWYVTNRYIIGFGLILSSEAGSGGPPSPWDVGIAAGFGVASIESSVNGGGTVGLLNYKVNYNVNGVAFKVGKSMEAGPMLSYVTAHKIDSPPARILQQYTERINQARARAAIAIPPNTPIPFANRFR